VDGDSLMARPLLLDRCAGLDGVLGTAGAPPGRTAPGSQAPAPVWAGQAAPACGEVVAAAVTTAAAAIRA
jgi:hypothetical protein